MVNFFNLLNSNFTLPTKNQILADSDFEKMSNQWSKDGDRPLWTGFEPPFIRVRLSLYVHARSLCTPDEFPKDGNSQENSQKLAVVLRRSVSGKP